MSLTFSNNTYAPLDRDYFMAALNSFITLGTCSYIGGMILKNPGHRVNQILIGRYASLSWDISCITWNHMYNNVVSTYPFQIEHRRKKISEQGHFYSKVANFTQQQVDNHFQTIIGNDVWIGHGATIKGGVTTCNLLII